MSLYKKMYLHLFSVITDVLKLIAENSEAARRLRLAQQECEKIYIEADEEEFKSNP